MTINWIQIGVEFVVLLGGFVIMYWKQRVEAEHRLTKVETLVSELKEDHRNLDGKVSGISRNLAEISGELKRSNGRNNK